MLAQSPSLPLSSLFGLSVDENRYAINAESEDALSFLAAEWLADHAGERALLEYFRLLPPLDTWQEAFERAFGLTVDDFYERFEEYRALLAAGWQQRVSADALLPHLTDDEVRPVLVFLGDVPATTRETLEQELDDMYALLTERLGASPYEYSYFFAADDESALPVRDGRYLSAKLPEHICAVRGGDFIFRVSTCPPPRAHRQHIFKHWEIALANTSFGAGDPPRWLDLGGWKYVDTLYRAEHYLFPDQRSFDDERILTQHNVHSVPPLRELGAPRGWTSAHAPTWDLAFLAIDWLLQHAGERALFEYYRLLPRTTNTGADPEGWRDAFEEAFGLTIEKFYEQFEAYRETLTTE